MPTITQPNDLRDILQNARTIAVVGYSDNPAKVSYQIGKQLVSFGYTVYPVNPTVSEIDGQTVYPDLAAVPQPIDIVNVFRRPEHLLGVVEEAIQVGAKVVWAQLGIADEEAARRADEAGLKIVMDNCIKVSYYQFVR